MHTPSSREVKLTEQTLRERFLVEAPKAIPTLRLFYRNIIDQRVERNGRSYSLKSGTAGMADLFGFDRRGSPAIPVELELKAWNGVQSKEQIAWMTFVTTMKIPFLLLRQKRTETTEQTVSRWLTEVEAMLSSTTRSTLSSTDSPALAPPTAPTSETPSDLSDGAAQTCATLASGESGSRGTAPSGRRTRRAPSLPLFGRRA